jgi:hypothetical protein
MPFVQLDLKSLHEIDEGRVGIGFMKELQRAVLDCIDRPKDKGKRKVAIVAEIVPVLGEGQIIECDGAEVAFKIKSTVPERKSKTYTLRVNKQGHMAFSSTNPEDPNQSTIFDINQKTGKVDRSIQEAQHEGDDD